MDEVISGRVMSDSSGLRLDGNCANGESDIGTPYKSDGYAEQYGACTPQQSENKYMDNSIFNTISKIVNPTTKVPAFVFLIFIAIFNIFLGFYKKFLFEDVKCRSITIQKKY